MDKFIVAVWII